MPGRKKAGTCRQKSIFIDSRIVDYVISTIIYSNMYTHW